MSDKYLGSGEWKRRRLLVLKAANYECTYCGQPANSVDHVVPRSVDNSATAHNLDNLVACCIKCNSSKGGRFFRERVLPPLAFRESLSIVHKSPFQPEAN